MTRQTITTSGLLALTVACGLSCQRGDNIIAFGPGTGGEAQDSDTGSTQGAGTVAADSATGTQKLDVQSSGGSCASLGNLEFSHIWIANSTVGTVSKIDTVTAIELARYRTGPSDPNPDPSRTAVNLHGDVAVVNRHPNPIGVVKIAARESDCIDRNADGVIQTSSGPNDVLPWGEDECILWWSEEQDFFIDSEGGNVWGPRPTAWDSTSLDPDASCPTSGGRLWVGWYDGITQNQAHFQRLDGTNGEILDTVVIPQWSDNPQLRTTPYGAAAARGGDLWVLGRYTDLALIDGVTLEVEVWRAEPTVNFYSMALDADERPWIAGWDGNLYSFDRDSGTFVVEASVTGRLRGLAIDFDGQAWVAANGTDGRGCWLMHYDTVGGTLVDGMVELPGCRRPVGVAIDAESFVWVVDNIAEVAYKLDPSNYAIQAITEGLIEPYTYSDMTGFGLKLVAGPG